MHFFFLLKMKATKCHQNRLQVISEISCSFSEMLVVQKSKWLNAPKIIIDPLLNPGPALFIYPH